MKTSSVVGVILGTIFRIVCTVLIVVVIYKGAVFCYDYGYRIFTEPAISTGTGRTVTVTIPKGMSAKEMGELLAKQGLVEDPTLFILQYYASEYRKDIKPGTFELSTAMTAEEMMKVMAMPQDTEEAK
jgi:UPF0755 protein